MGCMKAGKALHCVGGAILGGGLMALLWWLGGYDFDRRFAEAVIVVLFLLAESVLGYTAGLMVWERKR